MKGILKVASWRFATHTHTHHNWCWAQNLMWVLCTCFFCCHTYFEFSLETFKRPVQLNKLHYSAHFRLTVVFLQNRNEIYSAVFATNGREFRKLSDGVSNTNPEESSLFPNEQYKFNGRQFRLGINYVSLICVCACVCICVCKNK